ncbi:MAG: hypothetical protein ABW318_21070 [Vicinamibacterales bacterium]
MKHLFHSGRHTSVDGALPRANAVELSEGTRIPKTPGERTKVTLTIDPAASNHPPSVWNSGTSNWSTAPGFYPLYLGRSSADIALRGTLLVRPPQ